MKIIDVSYHNGNINFKQVKASGIGGVIIRAGYGLNNIDTKFKTYINDAIAVGLPVGIYWFSYAYTLDRAKKEAAYCLKAIEPYKDKITLGVFFDWEYDSMNYARKAGVTAEKILITNMTLEFCKAIAAAGYKAGYYLNKDYAKHYYDESKLKGYLRWYARYTSVKQTDCYMWQYSDKGKVIGINGNVDMNMLYGEAASSKAENEVKNMKVYNTINEIPDWGKAVVEKLIKAGALKGTDKGLDLSNDLLRMLVINDRMGLYDK